MSSREESRAGLSEARPARHSSTGSGQTLPFYHIPGRPHSPRRREGLSKHKIKTGGESLLQLTCLRNETMTRPMGAATERCTWRVLLWQFDRRDEGGGH